MWFVIGFSDLAEFRGISHLFSALIESFCFFVFNSKPLALLFCNET